VVEGKKRGKRAPRQRLFLSVELLVPPVGKKRPEKTAREKEKEKREKKKGNDPRTASVLNSLSPYSSPALPHGEKGKGKGGGEEIRVSREGEREKEGRKRKGGGDPSTTFPSFLRCGAREGGEGKRLEDRDCSARGEGGKGEKKKKEKGTGRALFFFSLIANFLLGGKRGGTKLDGRTTLPLSLEKQEKGGKKPLKRLSLRCIWEEKKERRHDPAGRGFFFSLHFIYTTGGRIGRECGEKGKKKRS